MKSPKNVPHVIQMAFSQHELSCRFTVTFDRRSQNAKLANAALRSPLSNGVGFIPIRWFLIFFLDVKNQPLCCRVISSSCDGDGGAAVDTPCALWERVYTGLRLEWGAGLRVQWKGGRSLLGRSRHLSFALWGVRSKNSKTKWDATPTRRGRARMVPRSRSGSGIMWRGWIWCKYRLWPISMHISK